MNALKYLNSRLGKTIEQIKKAYLSDKHICFIVCSEPEFIEEIITQIINGKKSTKKEFLNSLAKSLACKKSIKANEYHNATEIEYLLDDLRNTENPFTCPHGRPIIIKFDKYEIEKWFKRVV